MLEEQVKKNGILGNLITLSNLVEKEINGLLGKLGLNYLEYSILVSVLNNETTQYRIAKKYNISIQRSHQIIKKLKKKTYIIAVEEKKGGRLLKNLFVAPEINKKIDDVNIKIKDKLENKKINHKNLEEFNDILKILIGRLENK